MNNREITKKKIGAWSVALLLLYIGILIYFVLFSDQLGRTAGYNDYHYNLVPFQEIRRFVVYRGSVSAGAFLLNLIGNIAVFIPIGFLIPLIEKQQVRLVNVFAYSLILSFMIEATQLFTKVGVFDVDDLILNTFGGVLGWLLYLLGLRIYNTVSERKGES